MKTTKKTRKWIKSRTQVCLLLLLVAVLGRSADGLEKGLVPKPTGLNQPPEGFAILFNGKDLTGWKGLLNRPYDNPIERAKLSPEKLAAEQAAADKIMQQHWQVKDGILEFDGKGFSLATMRDYDDFELLVDWKIIHPNGDSGIYLRGTPQVQIWDPGQRKIGSGGLYNNRKHPSNPTKIADNPIGQWNTFYIKIEGSRVTVYLNGELVVDNIVLENYWDRSQPVFASGQIELQCHGDPIHFRNIFVREIPRDDGPGSPTEEEKAQGFISLFNGEDLTGWTGSTEGYAVEDGKIICQKGGDLYTKDEFGNFIFRFEFKLTPAANNGLGIRAPLQGDAAYQGMEIQILDDTADEYKKLQPYQYHGSIYGVVPAKRGCLKPVGYWNYEEVMAIEGKIRVTLNGGIIVDADISQISEPIDHRPHPGLKREKGHIGFLGHDSQVEFRNIRIKKLNEK